ncbi:hypothetical protein OAF65_05315 [Verrucomicrobiales bacterium]|nr:hypothetical protein [Verrucomicrobiales bacterium]
MNGFYGGDTICADEDDQTNKARIEPPQGAPQGTGTQSDVGVVRNVQLDCNSVPSGICDRLVHPLARFRSNNHPYSTVGVSDRQGVAEWLAFLQTLVQFSAYRAQGGGSLPKLREPVSFGCAVICSQCSLWNFRSDGRAYRGTGE